MCKVLVVNFIGLFDDANSYPENPIILPIQVQTKHSSHKTLDI